MRTKLTIALIVAIAISIFAFIQFSFTGQLTRTGQFALGNTPPVIMNIYLNGYNTSSNPNDVIIDPLENSTRNVTVKVRIQENNGDCNLFTSNNGTVYFCNGVVTCNSTNANYTTTLVYNTSDGQSGPGNIYCNMSGLIGVPFYILNGTWTVNATVTDGVVNSTAMVNNWTYGELPAFGYAPSGIVNMGTLTLASWNNGTGQNELRNTGNIILDTAWNATNFTGQAFGDTLNISGTNYIIDDDALSPDDTDNLQQVFISENANTQVDFIYVSGLLRCTSVACSNTNATMQVYWHLYVPSGLLADTYTNPIEVTGTYH